MLVVFGIDLPYDLAEHLGSLLVAAVVSIVRNTPIFDFQLFGTLLIAAQTNPFQVNLLQIAVAPLLLPTHARLLLLPLPQSLLNLCLHFRYQLLAGHGIFLADVVPYEAIIVDCVCRTR